MGVFLFGIKKLVADMEMGVHEEYIMKQFSHACMCVGNALKYITKMSTLRNSYSDSFLKCKQFCKGQLIEGWLTKQGTQLPIRILINGLSCSTSALRYLFV